MINFCLLVGLVGIAAGILLPFLAATAVVAGGMLIAIVKYAWEGVPLQHWILPAALCLVFVQVGYAIGLALKAFVLHRSRTAPMTLNGKNLSREKRPAAARRPTARSWPLNGKNLSREKRP